jgi:hypothetical protein
MGGEFTRSKCFKVLARGQKNFETRFFKALKTAQVVPTLIVCCQVCDYIYRSDKLKFAAQKRF